LSVTGTLLRCQAEITEAGFPGEYEATLIGRDIGKQIPGVSLSLGCRGEGKARRFAWYWLNAVRVFCD